ncbi:MAG: VTT domain-containing protein [Saccharofermentans sp.]|nr:VTT domain-containing protein [Saccharofermentans sp.]
MTKDKTLKRKRILAILILVCISAVILGISYFICKPMLEMARDPQAFQHYMHEKKPWSILMFMCASFLQVVAAVIPGGPFELAAGYAFGILRGTIICDISMTTGSVFVFLMVRRFGMRFAELFVSKEKIESVKFLKQSNRRDLLTFLFFLIPGTPKDIFTYFVGFTDMKLSTWIFITFVGRFPAIFLSVVSGDAAGEKRYFMAIIVIAVIIVTAGIGYLFYNRYQKKHSADK